MPTAEVNGTTLFYETVGSGPPCLVMHGGLGFDHSYFRPDFDQLGDLVTLVYYDHRCNGRSGRPPLATLTLEQLADDAAGLADHLGAERVFAMGHSYGGFVVQEFAARHPDRIAGLVLVDTTPGGLGAADSPEDDQGPPPPPELGELMQHVPTKEEEFDAFLPKITPFYLHRLDPSVLETALRNGIIEWKTMVYSMMLLSSWSVVDRLADFSAPALAIAGRQDVFTSWPQAARMARHIPDSELVVIDESGHFPWMEEPDAFFAAVRDWLSRHLVGA
jgi:proline iminopeptidase